MLVIVLFCREGCSKAAAERFLALMDLFKSRTDSLAAPEKVFAAAA